jgi:TolB-like protein
MERPFAAYKGSEPYIFVSYAHEDAALVYPEITRLRDQGFNIWYDEGISPGSTWRDEIAAALTQCRVFLFLITPRSAGSSNCLKEVNFALSRERKILAVHLESTQLPVGLELSLSDMQAIIRADHNSENYEIKVHDALSGMMPDALVPIPIEQQPVVQTDSLDIYSDPTAGNSIAIMPLVNRNLGDDMDYLGDGISEELISGLSKIADLKVASQMASFRFKGQDIDPKELGQLLGVKSILAGSLQRSGSRVRVSVLLSQAEDGSTLWSQRYEGDLDDIFALQDDVARNVVDALRIELAPAEQSSLIDAGTHITEAYDAYLLGKYEMYKQTQVDNLHALDHFERAVKLDPDFARAYTEIANCCSMAIGFYGLSADEFGPRAMDARTKVVSLGHQWRTPARVYERQIYPHLNLTDLESALEACEKIEHPDPEWNSHEYYQLAMGLSGLGLFQSAIDFFERYVQLTSYQLGELEGQDNSYVWLYEAAGHFDRAIEIASELIEIRPDRGITVGERALMYSRTGQYQKAEKDLEYITRIWPRNFAQFYHLYWKREIDAARAYYGWLDKRRNLPVIYKVWGSFLLHDLDRGQDYLEEYVNQGGFGFRVQLQRMLPQSVIDELNDRSRFKDLLKKNGSDEASRDTVIQRVNEVAHLSGIEVKLDSNN